MNGLVTVSVQQTDQPSRQLRINQKTSSSQRHSGAGFGQVGCIEQAGAKVLRLKVGVIRQNLCRRRPRTHQLERHFHRVSEPPDAGFPMTNVGIDGDALE